MQQRTKCNINWQIEGPETPQRILVAKREGREVGRVVSQTLFGGTEMMPRHHQLKGREREGDRERKNTAMAQMVLLVSGFAASKLDVKCL